ncbi:hypothetical protein Adi01nite_66580 [Amorphoplanes digitatis]|uniref:DUF5130 domain-containing protein n=2 Tax=Actinoplanes digitatis TaxID=1868 RepID=A0A7W7MT43_9ACTN|nr:hypothetical protein [Actinoplanes digitatis]GID97246.1 hypothetical protein Adi01nite_66580 [Actinoplanes digitatis]
MTVGETQALTAESREQPLTALDHPGGPTLTAYPELTMSPAGIDALDGPFTTRQLLRLDEALRVADQSTGLTFSVYIGDLEEPAREHAEQLHRQLDGAATAVLVAVSPNQRVLEIVTGPEARKRITDRDAKLAALSMAAAFAGGDLAGGVLSGLDQLASHAGRH